MERIKRFIECLIPVTACNLKCEYCYVIQENRRKLEMPKFKYEPKVIGEAFSKKRLGGTSYISICGAGETLLTKELPQIVNEILKQGHFVNITTNGTISDKFDEIIDIVPDNFLKHLHFAFSLHYIELKKTGNIERFVENVKKVKQAGCSFVVQLNLYDGYIEFLDEIKAFCKKEFGAFPQVAVTRKETMKDKSIIDVKYHTDKTNEEYEKIGREFDSPLFDYTIKNFMISRKEFCYAGQWSLLVNLSTGMAKKCYSEPENQNIFEDLSKPIEFKPIGFNCRCKYCMNSSHFISLGIIPEEYTKSYSELRNRKGASWYSKEMEDFLSTKLFEENKSFSKFQKYFYNLQYILTKILKKIKRIIINEK